VLLAISKIGHFKGSEKRAKKGAFLRVWKNMQNHVFECFNVVVTSL
jgi:hypothetical protein